MSKEQIQDYISAHKDEMLKCIGELIKINSEKMPAEPGMPYGPGPAKALLLAMSMAEGFGFKTKNYDNFVGCIDFGEGEKELDILAHLDVVPVTPEGWTVTAPFEPLVVNDRLYGRGSSDDKGPAMAALFAMKAVKDLGIPLKKSVRLILGCDEECGSSDIAHYYAIEKEAPCTFSPDAEFPVINLEKGHYVSEFTAQWSDHSDREIVSLHAGSKFNVIPGDAVMTIRGLTADDIKCCQAEAESLGVTLSVTTGTETVIAVHGKSGHAASPENACNALTAALDIASAVLEPDCSANVNIINLSEMFPQGDYLGESCGVKMSDEISGELTLSLDMCTLKDGELSATFDMRVPVCGNTENTADVLEKRGAELGLTLAGKDMSSPHYVPEDSDFIRILKKDYEMYKGRPGYCMAIGGGTYVHGLKNGVAFGPAEIDTVNNMHGNDENIPIEELLSAACIYAQVIIDLCS